MRMHSPSLSELHAFAAAARLGSYSLAARELYVTQGGISRAIARLEEHLGFALFERQGRRVTGLRMDQGVDRRLLRCRRPIIITGGELTLDMLDIRFDPYTRLYQAPLQLKASNGLFIIDDLGRQRMPPAELFNRWIVPMEEKRDFLNLGGGIGIAIVGRRAQVGEQRMLAQGNEAMGKAFRDPEMTLVVRAQQHGRPLAEGGRTATDVDRHVPDLAFQHRHVLALRIGPLVVQPAQHAAR